MESPAATQPWRELPPSAADALAPELPGVADEIIAAISEGVPEYVLPLEGPFGRGLRHGVEQALRRFLDTFGSDDFEPDPRREIYVELGRGELRAGRPLEALLAAYRLGARVAWRRLAEAGEGAGLDPQTLYLLAESIFAYIDEISAESVEGFAMEQAAAAGESQRRRNALARLLVQDPPAAVPAVEAAAAEAGWALPRAVAAVVCEGADPDRLAGSLGSGVIAVSFPPGVCALVPDPEAPGRRSELESALDGRAAALGPTVTWPQALVSALRARDTLGLGAGPGLVAATEHRLELLLRADRPLAAELAEDALAPLAAETEASRARLEETLAAWLEEQGRTERVAAILDVHPQTVRYRLRRLRELFGEALDQANTRFELQLALRLPAPPDA